MLTDLGLSDHGGFAITQRGKGQTQLCFFVTLKTTYYKIEGLFAPVCPAHCKEPLWRPAERAHQLTCLKNSSRRDAVQRWCSSQHFAGWLMSAVCSSSDKAFGLSILETQRQPPVACITTPLQLFYDYYESYYYYYYPTSELLSELTL